MEVAHEMLQREIEIEKQEYLNGIKPFPMLILNPDKTNFYDFTIEDFIMENYEPIRPQLKLELGI